MQDPMVFQGLKGTIVPSASVFKPEQLLCESSSSLGEPHVLFASPFWHDGNVFLGFPN